MRFCFDIDGVLNLSDNYDVFIPNVELINRIKTLHESGHEIILYTARKMNTFKGNIGLVTKHIHLITLKQLEENNVVYDEIYFGKPAADVYIDDKAINIADLEF
jgi:capsule biosynthesis phosphatase